MDSSQTSVLVPTSAVPSHPSTYLMDQTIAGIQYHLPKSPIIIMADGVWAGVKHRTEQYVEYLNAIKNRYPNTRIQHFVQHTQQTAMCQYAIQNYVQTPYIFFNEHDAPLRTDRFIDWDAILQTLQSGDAELVRLSYFEEGIHEAHEHLTRGRWQDKDATFVKTTQFSGWPFMTTTKYFVDKILQPPIEKKMLEHTMYEKVANSSWEQYKVVVYCPDGPAQRFTHSNGRGYGVEERDPCDWQ